jgi:hypothetical protein
MYQSSLFSIARAALVSVLLSGFGFQVSALAVQSATLNWDPSTNPNVAGYKIYYGTLSHDYTNAVTVGNMTNATITGLLEGTIYFFAATTYDASGVESGFSNEASYAVPGDPTTSTNSTDPTNSTIPPIPPTIPTNPPASFQPPALNAINNISVNENAGSQTINLSGLTLGTINLSQPPAIAAISGNPALVPNPTVNYTVPNAAGTLTFTPAHGASGTTTVTVTINNGQPQSNLVSRSFTVTVKPVAQPPSLNAIGNFIIGKNSAPLVINLSGITSGATNQNQKIQVTAAISSRFLISSAIVKYTSPNTTGTLTLNPARNAIGTTVITVTVNNGSKNNNIVTQKFTVTVLAQNMVGPAILNKLTNNVVVAGQTAKFNVIATGTGPLKYQWKFNGAPLPGQTNSTLTLNNVTTGQTGAYSANVSNAAGSMDSPSASLIVYSSAAATLTSPASANGQFNFDVSGVPGWSYVVQASTNLVDWENVQTNTAPFTFTDVDASKYSHCYYRAVCQSQ